MYKLLSFCCGFFLLSCQKEQVDDTKTAQMAVVHAATSAGKITINVGAAASANLEFEQITGDVNNIYTGIAVGIQLINIENEAGSYAENFPNYFELNNKSTLFLYDTISALSERKPALFKINDPVKALDDGAYFRFIHLATGIDSVAAVLMNTTDTLVLAVDWRQPAYFNNHAALAAFRGPLKAGLYDLVLYDKNGDPIYVMQDVPATSNKSETIYTYGAYNPIGQPRLGLNKVFNN